MSTDRELIQSVLEGDRDLYGDLIERYARQTHAVAFGYLQDASDAEEVSQEAFLCAFQKLRTLSRPEAFGAWICQITRNLCRRVLKKRKNQPEPLDEHPDLPDSTISDARQRVADKRLGTLLHESLDRLSPKVRECLVLFYLEEYSISQIAGFLNIPENTVKQRLHRGRNLLREEMEKALRVSLQEIRPSKNFHLSVVAMLPAQPLKLGWIGALLVNILKLPWVFYFLPILALPIKDWLYLSDLDANDREGRSQYRKTARKNRNIILILVFLLLPLFWLTSNYPWLLVLWWMYIGYAVFNGRRWFSLVDWTTRLWVVVYLGLCISLSLGILFPQHAADFVYLALIFLFIVLGLQVRPTIGLYRKVMKRDGGDPYLLSNDEDLQIPPVSVTSLQTHAKAFIRRLNSPVVLFGDAKFKDNRLEFESGKIPSLFHRFEVPSEEFTVTLDARGNAEARLKHPERSLSSGESVESFQYRAARYVRRKWACYLTGKPAEAQSEWLGSFPEDKYIRSRGRRMNDIHTLALFLLMFFSLVISFYLRGTLQLITEPDLTTAKVKEFYLEQFLPDYQQGTYPGASMLIYDKHPPLINEIPELKNVFLELQKKRFESLQCDSPDRAKYLTAAQLAKHGMPQKSIAGFDPVNRLKNFHIKDISNGMESGYLTVAQIEQWGLTRVVFTTFDPDTLISDRLIGDIKEKDKINFIELEWIVSTSQLLHQLGAFEPMDSQLAEEVLKKVHYENGIFSGNDKKFPREIKTTALMACLLTQFDRWDLVDKQAVRDQLIDWIPRWRTEYSSPDDLYYLAKGLIAVGEEDEVRKAKMSKRIHPKIGVNSKKSDYLLSPFDIQVYAIKEILEGYEKE